MDANTNVQVVAPQTTSSARRWFLLFLFCIAQFLEVFNSSAIFIALPAASSALHMTAQEGAWLIASYQLTFASFLLVSGRFSDVYNPKYVFLAGLACFGLFSLGSGFSNNAIGLLVVRAFTGLAASIHGSADVDGPVVLGLILGAILVQFATWRWVFWIGGVVGLPVSVLCLFVIPNRVGGEHRQKPKNIDLVGFGFVTSALLLLIFGVTSGSSLGWNTPDFIAPFVISIPPDLPTLHIFFISDFVSFRPPRIWFYPNFSIITLVSLTPFFWFANIFYTFSTTWQVEFHWNALISAVHFLPLGILITLVIPFASRLPDRFSTKWIVLVGDALLIGASALLACSHIPRDYWRLTFPAFIIGTIGGTLVFSSTNITIFRVTPPEMAGTVGAVYNAGLQLSTAMGIPIITAIQVGVNAGRTDDTFKGRAAGFWYVLALVAVQALAVVVFYQDRGAEEKGVRQEKKGEGEEVVGGSGQNDDKSSPAASETV
ncbi:hypothetical protein AN958_01273 [Leucoagaricus sp. SymC.cos]|nr:hypothetical protein AN958_01273 [Leucoagaricus sp. SymC.cos]